MSAKISAKIAEWNSWINPSINLRGIREGFPERILGKVPGNTSEGIRNKIYVILQNYSSAVLKQFFWKSCRNICKWVFCHGQPNGNGKFEVDAIKQCFWRNFWIYADSHDLEQAAKIWFLANFQNPCESGWGLNI